MDQTKFKHNKPDEGEPSSNAIKGNNPGPGHPSSVYTTRSSQPHNDPLVSTSRAVNPAGCILFSLIRHQRPSTSLIIPLRCNTPRSTCSSIMATVSHASSPIVAGPVPALETDSTWSKRKPTHLGVESACSCPARVRPVQRTVTGFECALCKLRATQKHTKLERLRRKLGKEVSADAVFPSSPRTPRTPLTPRTAVPKTSKTYNRPRAHPRTRSSYARPEDTQSITISISSDEGMQTVTLRPSTSHVRSHRSQKPKNGCHTSALPPAPHAPTHHSKSSGRSGADDDDAGLIRPRQQVAAGSKIGGSDFKAARRAKREGRSGQGEIGEMTRIAD
ncbi:hypothetical protein EV401DRAFT_2171364 [Pisolithus croceorrhizus]|nr:hypothetical protein EV401DRAFT_2171364 [Pisolithus croceorrhizus]